MYFFYHISDESWEGMCLPGLQLSTYGSDRNLIYVTYLLKSRSQVRTVSAANKKFPSNLAYAQLFFDI